MVYTGLLFVCRLHSTFLFPMCQLLVSLDIIYFSHAERVFDPLIAIHRVLLVT